MSGNKLAEGEEEEKNCRWGKQSSLLLSFSLSALCLLSGRSCCCSPMLGIDNLAGLKEGKSFKGVLLLFFIKSSASYLGNEASARNVGEEEEEEEINGHLRERQM